LIYSIDKNASDIHFNPKEDGIIIRIRIDGELRNYADVPGNVKKNMITRIKILAGMNITESRVPQDGAIKQNIHGKDVVEQINVISLGLYVHTEISAAKANNISLLADDVLSVGNVARGKGDLLAGQDPSIENPRFSLVVGVHQPDVTKIGIIFGLFAGAKGIVSGTLAVPPAFVMEPTKKAVGVGANIQPKGPNTAAG
jgi:hypothetical protein